MVCNSLQMHTNSVSAHRSLCSLGKVRCTSSTASKSHCLVPGPPAEPSSSSSSEHGSQASQSGTDIELSRMQLLLVHEIWQATSCTALTSGPAMACYTFSAAESSVHMAVLQVHHTHLRRQTWGMLMGLPHANASVQRLSASRGQTGARLPSRPRAGLQMRTNVGKPSGVRAALHHDQRYSIHMCSASPWPCNAVGKTILGTSCSIVDYAA